MADDELSTASETAPQQPDAEAPATSSSRSIGRTVTVVSLRVVRGLVGAAAAVAVIAAVGFVPLPTVGLEPLATTVTPEPADLLELCTGSLLRLGDDSGADAATPSAVGTPSLTVSAEGGSPARSPLATSDAGSGGTAQAPTTLRLAGADDAALAGAQAQFASGAAGLRGLAATACSEPTSSAWLVGGATTVGRTTLLLLANPTEVRAEVSVQLWGESGVVTAPGMSGIEVPAGGQRVLPLSGFAPDLVSPVVHVEARGGQVVAALQTSVIRVLDAGGVDLISPGAAPSRRLLIPAVRIFDATNVAASLGIDGYADLEAVVRIANPGDAEAHVEVSVMPTATGGSATSFDLEIAGGEVLETPLAAALALGAEPFGDGSYAVEIVSDEPVVAGVRTATTTAPTADGERLDPGSADLAWAAAAPALAGDVQLAVADAPAPVLVVVAADGEAHTLTLLPDDGGEALTLEVPASGPVALPLSPDTGYRITGSAGVALGVSYAADGRLASSPAASPRAGDQPIVIRP